MLYTYPRDHGIDRNVYLIDLVDYRITRNILPCTVANPVLLPIRRTNTNTEQPAAFSPAVPAHLLPLSDQVIGQVQQDQLVMRALLPSLSEQVIGQVLLLTNSRVVWDVLENMFSSDTRARTIHILLELGL